MGLFGPGREKEWRELCPEIGAEFIEGRFPRQPKVRVQAKPWTITLDISPQGDTTATRFRAPFVSANGIRFILIRQGRFSALSKVFGMHRVELGDAAFDEAYYLQGNDEDRVRALFGSAEVRQKVQDQPDIHLEVKDDEGWFGPRFPKNVDELRFEEERFIDDPERLKSLFDLFAAVLDQLCWIGSACRQDPGVEL